VRPRRPASAAWRAFLQNHASEIVALDFFTVPTVSFRVLFVLIVLAHDRRRILHFNVTEHPTAQWTAQQLVEAFPWDTAPRYLLRDRDAVYGQSFQQSVAGLGMAQVLTTPRSPWQNAYAERLIGSIRRECLEHVIVFSEDHLRRVLARYFVYYHRWRTHLSLAMDSPDRRPVQLPDQGAIVAVPEVGGLHHHYERRAA
jgi:putative transposase